MYILYIDHKKKILKAFIPVRYFITMQWMSVLCQNFSVPLQLVIGTVKF